MTHLNIHLDEETSTFVREYAAKRGITVDQYMSHLVRMCMDDAIRYEKARQKFMEIVKHPFGGTWEGGRRPTREELYDERFKRFR